MVPVNILVAVHGHEPSGWTREVPRVIAAHGFARLRVLMVLDAPPVAFTSVLPAARRRFDAALAETRQRDSTRVSATVGESDTRATTTTRRDRGRRQSSGWTSRSGR